MQNPYIEKKLVILTDAIKSGDTLSQFKAVDDIYTDGYKDAQEEMLQVHSDGMTETQSMTFVALLEMFKDNCGLDRMEACTLAQLLLGKINE